MTAPSSESSATRSVIPSEVGWQFVPQYYTFVNKQPDRLHCFYTKKSTFIHGTEGEDGKPCHGQQEIHAKITSLGFQDCKVFIHSVDAQSSANGGIIIQVIGEMSNRNEPWRKFVQTFFLAEQPNGYFVLNDIFRFLKEETVESDELDDSVAAEPEVESPSVPTAPEPAREPSPPPPTPPSPVIEPTPAPEVEPPLTPVEEPAVTVDDVPEPPVQVPTPEPEPKTNGVHVAAPEPVPTSAPPPAAVPQQQPAAPVAQAPPAKPQPKTWANLAAANSKKWGANVAQESRGTTEVVPPTFGTTTTTTTSGTQTPPTSLAAPAAPNARGPHPNLIAAKTVTTPHCFVKGVTEVVGEALLRHELGKFGPIKEVDIVRSKACAFVEYTTVEAARKAIINCLPASQGGGGGMWVEIGGDVGQVRITVETKKERGERPPSRPRGGAPQGEVRGGSIRGRGGRGRGTAQAAKP